MAKLLKLYGEFYPIDNVAGVCGGKVITKDNAALNDWMESPAFTSLDDPFLIIGGAYCEFCHNELDGRICYSCGATYDG